MTHNYKWDVWYKELMKTTVPALLYGITASLVGYPFDTLKTIIQTQKLSSSSYQTFLKEGKSTFSRIKWLYNGFLINSFGAVFYWMVSFSTFEASFTYFSNI